MKNKICFKFVKAKRQQAPTVKKPRQKPALKWYPRDLIGWTRHHSTTEANQNEGGKRIWSPTVYHLACEKEWFGDSCSLFGRAQWR